MVPGRESRRAFHQPPAPARLHEEVTSRTPRVAQSISTGLPGEEKFKGDKMTEVPRTYVFVPSRNRESTGTTFKALGEQAILVVHQDEEKAYRDSGATNEIWTHSCETLSEVRNHLLEKCGYKSRIVMLDDDITGVGEFVNELGRVVAKKLQWDEWLCKLLDVFNCAANAGYVLFGVSPTANPLCYRKPYTYNTFVNGPVTCVVNVGLRFTTDIFVKTDYEFTAKCVSHGYQTCRADFLWQKNDFDKMAGGRKAYSRGDTDRMESYYYLLSKYPSMFRKNPKRKWEVIMKPTQRKRG